MFLEVSNWMFVFLLWNVSGANERWVIPGFRALGISRQFSRSAAEADPSCLEHCAHTGSSSPAPLEPSSAVTAQLGLPLSEEPNLPERRRRSALLTWNESQPSLCDLSVQPTSELNKQPSEHTTKHPSLREQLLQWGQGCQPTNPAAQTMAQGWPSSWGHSHVELQLQNTEWQPWAGPGSATWQIPQSCSSPESYWLVYLPQPLYSVDFFYLSNCNHTRNGFGCNFRVKPCEQNVLITEMLPKKKFLLILMGL